MKKKSFSTSFFSVFCVMILSIALFTGCDDSSDDNNTPPTTTDTTAPTVSSTSPADAATGVDRTTVEVSITFSEEMDPTTITVNSTDGTCTGTIQISPDDFVNCIQWGGDATTSDNITFTVDPLGNLNAATDYKIRVTTAAEDAAGNALESVFTTATGFQTGI